MDPSCLFWNGIHRELFLSKTAITVDQLHTFLLVCYLFCIKIQCKKINRPLSKIGKKKMGKVTQISHERNSHWGNKMYQKKIKSEDPRFDPLVGQVEEQFFLYLQSQLVCRLVCAWSPRPFVCTARTQICVHVKDPISICHKRVGSTAGGMETRKHCTQEEKKKLGSARTMSARFLWGKLPKFHVHWHWDKKVI